MRGRLRSLRPAWLAAGVASVVAVALFSSTSTAYAWVSGTSWVIHAGTNLCMDDTGWSTANGARLQLYPCTGNTNQQWRENFYTACFYYVCGGGFGTFPVAQIQNVYSGKCLNVSGASSASGAPAIQWDCIPGATNEQFWIRPTSDGPPYWNIYAPRIGTCLDDPGNSSATGVKLQFYQCNLTRAQIWYASQWIGVTG
jgi:hypothetical protein